MKLVLFIAGACALVSSANVWKPLETRPGAIFYGRTHDGGYLEEVAGVHQDGGCTVVVDGQRKPEASKLCEAMWKVFCCNNGAFSR